MYCRLIIFVQIINNAMNCIYKKVVGGVSRTHRRPLVGTFFVLPRASCCVRYPEFGGYPLFRCCYCIKHMEISVGTYSSVHYLVEVRYWEYPLIESPLYLLIVNCEFFYVSQLIDSQT